MHGRLIKVGTIKRIPAHILYHPRAVCLVLMLGRNSPLILSA